MAGQSLFLRVVKITIGLAVFLGITGFVIWGAAALWFRAPGVEAVKLALSGSFALLGLLTLVVWFLRRGIVALVPFLLVSALLLGWWNTLDPPSSGNWSTDVARQVTGQIDGDILNLDGVRDFRWRSDTEFEENWAVKTYDLSKLESTDVFLSYWAGPEMAHFILSFGFTDGRFLAWSFEVRREKGGAFSPIADMFKSNTLVLVAATESDVVGLRTNIRKEDVRLFRVRSDPEASRDLLRSYVDYANRLAQEPRWYHSLTTNCTTVILKMLNTSGKGRPLDWRILANGFLPEYSYSRGTLNMDFSIAELRRLGAVSQKGQAFGLGPGYSDAIRQGVPQP